MQYRHLGAEAASNGFYFQLHCQAALGEVQRKKNVLKLHSSKTVQEHCQSKTLQKIKSLVAAASNGADYFAV